MQQNFLTKMYEAYFDNNAQSPPLQGYSLQQVSDAWEACSRFLTHKHRADHPSKDEYLSNLTPVPDVKENGWQPIDTAPKDGTKVLITDSDYPHNDATYVAHWSQSIGNGCWHINAYMNSYIPHPTHWQPLPIGINH